MINHDFKTKKSLFSTTRRRLSNNHLLLLGASLLVTGSLLAFSTNNAEAVREQPSAQNQSALSTSLALDLPSVQSPSPMEPPQLTSTPEPALTKKIVTVRRGDTLAAIFKREGFSARELHDIMQLGKQTAELKNIKPGESLEFSSNDSNKLIRLSYKTDLTRTLQVTHSEEGFSANEEIRTPEIRLTHASETIDSSLYQSGQKAGLNDNLIMELAGIFGWDVDFALDIRKGDNFTVLYEEKYLDGEKIGYGDIVAAQFINQGKVFDAVRFVDPDGNRQYFTPEGKSMRKAFLRSPVDFRRISSRFTRERFHPVLGKKRPHRGVDYAAATGTPIKAAGDGKIIFRGTKGGYGSTVVLQHGTQYTTLYAHLSSFKRGQRNGSHVKQGDIIGFVGSSGLATGPHLHYEFRVNGTHRNPLTVKFPDANPIDKKHKAQFLAQTQPLLAQLNVLSRGFTLAQNDTP